MKTNIKVNNAYSNEILGVFERNSLTSLIERGAYNDDDDDEIPAPKASLEMFSNAKEL